MEKYFSRLFKGRIGNMEFIVVFVIIAVMYELLKTTDSTNSAIGMIILSIVAFYNLSFLIRRAHDLDKSGWYLLLFLVPIVNFIILLQFLFVTGTKKKNRFGPPPAPVLNARKLLGLSEL